MTSLHFTGSPLTHLGQVESMQGIEPDVSIEARNDARKAKMLIKQRELLEKELMTLEKECATLVSSVHDAFSAI